MDEMTMIRVANRMNPALRPQGGSSWALGRAEVGTAADFAFIHNRIGARGFRVLLRKP
jgi:hypothetical protein